MKVSSRPVERPGEVPSGATQTPLHANCRAILEQPQVLETLSYAELDQLLSLVRNAKLLVGLQEGSRHV